MDFRSLLTGNRRGVPVVFGEGDPFAGLREINRLFEEAVRGAGVPIAEGLRTVLPRIDVRDSDRGLEVTAEIPGVDRNDIAIDLVDDMLTIRGEKKAEAKTEEKGVYMLERSYGSFSRSIPLPFAPEPERVEADFEKGVLRITMPKPAGAREKTRRIAIKDADGTSALPPTEARESPQKTAE